MFNSRPFVVLLAILLVAPVGALLAADTGDAPDSYGQATHQVVDGAPHLGEVAPDDNSPTAGPLADGDDNSVAANDEDGVFDFPALVQNGKSYTTNVFASNPTSAPVTLIGWIDYDGDGQFSADEAATDAVPPGAANEKFKLLWNDLTGVTTDFTGTTYARFRIASQTFTSSNAIGDFSDGEVEDYLLTILPDIDGDEIPDGIDIDDDNDGIPDTVEGEGVDTDMDGTPDFLDSDSDNDTIPDFIEAGANPPLPADSDGDGVADYLDLDSNNDDVPDSQRLSGDDDGDGITSDVEGSGDTDGDGILDAQDLDSDNDTIPDAIEVGADPQSPVDSDGDGVPDMRDLDSDNDGLPDFREASSGEVDINPLDMDFDGRVDGDQIFGANGIVDAVETQPDSGVPAFALADSDGDVMRDYVDIDSDNDGVFDIIEAGGTDNDANGIVDGLQDTDNDGIADGVDVDITGGGDADGDGIDDAADADQVNATDSDGDGIIDALDVDVDGDGIIDGSTNLFTSGDEPFDLDDDNIPDFRDDDSVAGVVGSTTGGGTDSAGGTTSSDDGRLETGLSGFGAGCSLARVRIAHDPLLPALLLLSAVFVFRPRRH